MLGREKVGGKQVGDKGSRVYTYIYSTCIVDLCVCVSICVCVCVSVPRTGRLCDGSAFRLLQA